MKHLGLIIGACLLGIIASRGQDKPTYEKKPLPPGPIVGRAPPFSSWQIAFVYGTGKPGTGGSASAAAKSDPANSPGSTLPKLLTVTRTSPEWHALLVDASGNKKEVWFDGTVRIAVGPKDTDIAVSAGDAPGFTDPFLYYTSGPDFPDVEWVSPQNYLGMEKDTPDWVFQKGPDGPTVWIDSTTHYPVLWQRGGETRTIQFLSPPTGPIVLPPNLEALSLGVKRIKNLTGVMPGHV